MKGTTLALTFLLIAIIALGIVTAAPINSTDTHGMIVYADATGTDAHFQLWNSTQQNFVGGELNINDTGNLPQFLFAKASHQYDQVYVGSVSNDDKMHFYVYDIPSETFVHHTNVSNIDSQQGVGDRPIDIAVEDVSGDALVIYSNFTEEDNFFNYRIWDGTTLSAETSVTLSTSNSDEMFHMLIPKTGTDEIMFITQMSGSDLRYAILWNGTGFDEATAINASTDADGAGRTINFAWEAASGNGIFFYVETTNLVHRQFFSNNNSWGDQVTSFNLGGAGHDGENIALCPHPKTNDVGVMVQDGGLDVQAMLWNGTDIAAGAPDDEESIEENGAGLPPNYGCAWDKQGDYGMFYFTDSNSLQLNYLNYTKSNESWSETDLTNAPLSVELGTDDIKHLDVEENLLNNGTMLFIKDLTENLFGYIGNQSNFHNISANILETAATPTNGGGQNDFEWFRYDPNPTVVDLFANVTTVPVNGTLNFTVNVSDNLVLDSVLVNISKPDNEELSITAEDSEGIIFNLTVTSVQLNASGVYTFTVVANDTSRHMNINDTETLTIHANATPTVEDPVFNVSILTPSSGAISNTTYSDLEGDPGNIYFRWYRNDSEVFTENFTNIASGTPVNSTLTGVTLIGGDLVNVTVKADDDVSNSSIHNTSTLTVVGNAGPTVDVPVFNGTPTKTAGLGVNTTYKDEEGAVGSVNFEWFRNGSSVFTENVTTIANFTIVNSTLATSFYNIGDELNVTVFANDGEDNSPLQESALTTVANIIPTIDDPVFNLSEVTKTSGIGTNTTYYDDDEGIATVYFEWFRNGSSVFTENITSIAPNVTVNSTLSADFYNIGDELNITVYASDGRNDSTTHNSSTLIVANIIPRVDVPVFNVTNLTVESGVTANTTYYDDDEGVATVYFEWFTNATSAFTENITSIAPNVTVNSTLSTDLYATGDLVNVTVYASDGRNDSTTQESATITVNNLTPTGGNIDIANISGIDYTPTTPTKGNTIVFNATFNATTGNATNMNVTFLVDDVYVDGTDVNITAGSSLIVNFSWVLTNGTFAIRINADANNSFAETNETNNNVSINVTVTNPSTGGSSGAEEVESDESSGAAGGGGGGGGLGPPTNGASTGERFSYLGPGDTAVPQSGNNDHKVSIESIYPNSAEISVGGQGAVILEGNRRSFDTNNNGIDDITVAVTEVVSYSKVSLLIETTDDPTTDEDESSQTTIEVSVEEAEEILGGVLEGENEETETETEEEGEEITSSETTLTGAAVQMIKNSLATMMRERSITGAAIVGTQSLIEGGFSSKKMKAITIAMVSLLVFIPVIAGTYLIEKHKWGVRQGLDKELGSQIRTKGLSLYKRKRNKKEW